MWFGLGEGGYHAERHGVGFPGSLVAGALQPHRGSQRLSFGHWQPSLGGRPCLPGACAELVCPRDSESLGPAGSADMWVGRPTSTRTRM